MKKHEKMVWFESNSIFWNKNLKTNFTKISDVRNRE